MTEYSNHFIKISSTVRDALKRLELISNANFMVLFVIDEDDRLVGTITDGDLRRALLKGASIESVLDTVANKDFAFLLQNSISTDYIKQLRAINKKVVPLLDSSGRVVDVYDFSRRITILPVDAVLMAGGRGHRLAPLTDKIPKPLLMVGDKTIIDHNIDRLIKYGVVNFHITVNYLADQIIAHFCDIKSKKGVNVVCVREPDPLGTIGSLTMVSEIKNDTVLLMNSDLFTNIDYEDFYDDFIEKKADMSVATIPYNVDIPYAVMNLDGDRVRSFQEKPTITYYANAGIYLIKKTLLKFIPENTKYDATDFMDTLIANGCNLIRYPIIGYWVDIGKPQDYIKVQEFVKHIGK